MSQRKFISQRRVVIRSTTGHTIVFEPGVPTSISPRVVEEAQAAGCVEYEDIKTTKVGDSTNKQSESEGTNSKGGQGNEPTGENTGGQNSQTDDKPKKRRERKSKG